MRINTITGLLLVAAGLIALTPAYAADEDGFDINQVGTAYSDGYIGADHQFHPWVHRADAEEFRAKHLDRYRPYRHDDSHHAHDTQ